MVGKNPVVDRVWKAGHEVMPDICFDDTPSLWCFLNGFYCTINGVKKLTSERRDSSLIKLCRLDEFGFGFRVLN